MLNMIPEIFVFLMNSSNISSILREFWPNSDLKSSNGSIPRRHRTFQQPRLAGAKGGAVLGVRSVLSPDGAMAASGSEAGEVSGIAILN